MANFVGQRQGKTDLANGKGKLWSNGKGKSCHGAARELLSRQTAKSRQGKFWSNGNWANLLRQTARETSVASTSRQTSSVNGKGKASQVKRQTLRSTSREILLRKTTPVNCTASFVAVKRRGNFRHGKWQGQTCRGRRQTSLVNDKWQVCRSRAKESSVVGQRQGQASVHGKGKLRANGKGKLSSRQMANGNGKSLSRQRTKDSGQMAKGKLRRARQAMSRSSGKETSVTANGKGKPVAAGGKLPWSTTNGKFVEAGQRKDPS